MQFLIKCPVCETSLPSAGRTSDYGMRYECCCKRCGPFTITKIALDQLERKLETDKTARGRLSYAIRLHTNNQHPLEVAENTAELLATPLPPASKQVDLLLLALAQDAGDDRAAKVKRDDTVWSALIGTIKEEDVAYVIKESLKKGLIADYAGMNAVQLTIAGWEHVEALRSPQASTASSIMPPNASRAKPAWVSALSDQSLQNVLDEVYRALDQSLLLLALIGARTAFDRAMYLFVQDPPGGFQGKLTAMKAASKINDREIAILRPMIDAGNAAAHRGWSPTSQVMSDVMDEVEHVLRDWFVRDAAAAAVRAATPSRT